ncbi:TetR/AcrR family transcriptional regulator [Tenggerimyces flavus]|uniref:TetR/AcrR family transcriptional regulator n=1 Tax=Tenggerimyces flavus TaxID=1708749 RepID=A0ABV7YFP9_9ACTN|nr:TetR/AcrR family transcriptional regulator [Tenggerimyces flavus]MBM7783419.1 AcrR family transcriptional regulator [Tenggerimyces flavus]
MTPELTEQPGRRGRPRDPGADRRILDAARQLLATDGYEALAVDRVAEHAGVAKTTLYRRWPSKAHLVIELVADLQGQVRLEETGDLRNDLTALVRGITVRLHAVGAALVADLAAAVARDSSVALGIRELFKAWRGAAITILWAARDRGDLPRASNAEILVDQLVGPLYYRLLITGDPLTPEYATRLVDSVLGTHEPTS